MKQTMKHLTQLIAIGCIVISTSAFVAADSPSRPQTPVTPELIDLSTYAEWLDGVERPLETQQRELTPQWVLWTNAHNVQPGHSGVSFGDSKNAGARHLRIGFREAIPVGSVVVRGGGMLNVLKSDAAYPGDLSDDSQWIQVHFDPDQLDIAGVNPAADLPGDWQMDFQLLSADIAEITASGLELAENMGDLFKLATAIPESATYLASQVLRLAGVELRGAADELIPARGDEAVHVSVYVGDATGNEIYSGLDASWLARIAVGLDTGFDGLGTVDPMIVGDVTGNGAISALDASFVARKAVGLEQPGIPDVPPAPLIEPAPLLSAGLNTNGSAHQVGTRPPSGLFAAWDLVHSTEFQLDDGVARHVLERDEFTAEEESSPREKLLAILVDIVTREFVAHLISKHEEPLIDAVDCDPSLIDDASHADELLHLLAGNRLRNH